MGDPYWVTDPRAKGGRILVKTIEPTAQQKKRAAKRQKEFAKVPLQWAARAAECTRTQGAMVWIVLIYIAWKNNSMTFPLTNAALKRYGIHRNTKHRMLKILEDAELIKVEWRRKQSPIVTIVQDFGFNIT